MTSYSNNPHTVYNGLMSSQRNMFLSSSLAIIFIGFSKGFINKDVKGGTKLFYIFLSILASSILIISIFIGVESSIDYNFYISQNPNLPPDIPIDKWNRWQIVSHIYCAILIFFLLGFWLYIIRTFFPTNWSKIFGKY
jgi:hypothetical protein